MSLQMPSDDVASTTKRDLKAACEYLAVCREAPGLYEVWNDRSDRYLVDVRGGVACTCKDFHYRSEALGDAGCKHTRRVLMQLGDRPLPPIPESKIDPLLLRVREADK